MADLRSAPLDWLALSGAALTVALHLTLQADGPNPAFIGGACLFWLGFIASRFSRDQSTFRRWGFRTENLWQASLVAVTLFLVAAVGLGVYAHWSGTLRFPLHATLLFVAYPAWGLVQQFLVLGVVVANLELLPALGQRRALLVFLGAALFAAVHAYDAWLVVGTFLLEIVLVPLYLRYRNLWPLGVLHGWLAALFYLWALGRDIWAEGLGRV